MVQEPIRVEPARIGPVGRVAGYGPDIDEQAGLGWNVVAGDGAGLGGLPDDKRRRRVEAESLFDDGLEIGEIGEIGFVKETGFSGDGVEFLSCFGHGGWVVN